MIKKKERLRKLFNDETGKSVIIPMDHGFLGVMEGIEDPLASLKRFTGLRADALLINFGILKLAHDFISSLEDPPGIIMGVDYIQIWDYQGWKTPLDADVIIGHCISAQVEQAVKYNADAVKVYFATGMEPKLQLTFIKNICEIVSACDKHDMPLMIEPTTDGQYISADRKADPKIIADGCRMALEFGADILKVPYPGNKPEDKDRFAEICANSHVPVVMLGGSKKDSTLEILKVAQNGVEAGAKGTIFGRNVWQRPEEEMTRVVQALQDIVHRGVGAADAAGKYGITQ